MSSDGTGSPAPGKALSRGSALTYVIVVVVSLATVFGGLYVLVLTAQSVSSAPQYSLTFSESGLPAGTSWSVDVNGTMQAGVASSGASNLSFSEPNGFYNFTVPNAGGYVPDPSTAWVTVDGRDQLVSILFQRSTIPIASAFGLGNPVAQVCSSNETFAASGCTAGDFTYRITIEVSSVAFGSVLFAVRDPKGANYTVAGSGGFSILEVSGSVAAQIPSSDMGNHLWMGESWVTYASGIQPSTSLTPVYTLLIDAGTIDPVGLGLTLAAFGVGAYSGSTPPLSLP